MKQFREGSIARPDTGLPDGSALPSTAGGIASRSNERKQNGLASAGQFNISDLIDSGPFGRFQKLVVAMCFLLMTLDTFDLALIAFAAPVIAGAWHLPIASFGPVFALGLVGNLVGSVTFGSAADRIGRRYPVISGVAVFGLFTLLLPLAHSLSGLMVFRFLCGIGLGGVLPNCVATSSEFAPARIRSGVVTVAACGLPLGSMLAGWMAFWIIPAFGWKSIFYVGGVIPLALLPLLIFCLPESIRFLALNETDPRQLVRVLGKIFPSKRVADADRLFFAEVKASGSTVRGLFTEGRLPSTVLLWLLFLAGYLLTFLLLNWLPALLQQSGIPLKRAIVVASIFSLGGLTGGVTLGIYSKHVDPRRLMAYAFAAAALCIAALGLTIGHVPAMVLAVFFSGFFATGSQVAMYAVAAAAYRTAVRSTGIGWASGCGRVGSILGPLIGGLLLATGASVSGLLYLTAVPAIVGSAASLLLARQPRETVDIAPTT